MENDPAACLKPVPFAVENPELVPTERYFDEEFFKLERQRLWPHVWQMACRLEEIPEIGDYVEYTILDRSVIVVRAEEGVKAFLNACRHRGVRLANGPGNCALKGFVCPFHGWRYNLDGENTFVFGRHIFSEAMLDQAAISLAPVRIDFWAGCAFINFDDDARPLRECLGPVADRLDVRHVDQLKMDWWYATVLPTNWKLAMEAFQEGYHVMRTHPQLEAMLPVAFSAFGPDADDGRAATVSPREVVEMSIGFMKSVSEGMAGMVHETELAVIEKMRDMEVPDDAGGAMMAFYSRAREEIAKDGFARGAPMFDVAKVSEEYPFSEVEFVFPHFFLLPVFAAMSAYRIRPLTPETCLFEIWSLVLRPQGEAFETPTEPVMLPYDSKDFPEIPQQDYSNLPIQQLGLHNFEHMRLSHTHEGMISNYHRLIDGYVAGRDRAALAKGQQVVNSGFNAGILDIGF